MMSQTAESKRIHIVGIGGTGMSAIAVVLLQQGHAVSGSDQQRSVNTERLQAMGARIFIGHAAGQIEGADIVVYSSAIREDNPELIAARQKLLPLYKRPEWLGMMLKGKTSIAVAGTHGKTTTTALLSLALSDAGRQPSYIIGSALPELGANAAAGRSELFVIEADEYDRTFLALQPHSAVVTHLEWDHPDCYPTFDSMRSAFAEFVRSVSPAGFVLLNGDNPASRELDKFHPAAQTYGFGEHNDWVVVPMEAANPQENSFELLSHGKRVFSASLRMAGRHNLLNAGAAAVIALRLNVPGEVIASSLQRTRGAERRFELKGNSHGVTVIDDYAHHPTEIRATLQAARERFPGQRLWAVFQPHTFSRTVTLLDDFAAAFEQADKVILVDIFPSREIYDGSVSSLDILNKMKHPDARYMAGLENVASYLVQAVHPGDIVLTLGAGDGYKAGEMLLAGLGSRKE